MPRDPAQPPTERPHAAPPVGSESLLLSPQPLRYWLLLIIPAGFVLYRFGHASHLLFHLLTELLGIILAVAVFTIGWNARRIVQSPLFLILATGFMASAPMSLLHTLTYEGMAVFPFADNNLSIQLWIASRTLEALTFLVAAFHLGRPLRFSAWLWLCGFAAVAALLLVSIWPLRIFPPCFTEAAGSTPFKAAGEYLIVTLLATAALLLWRRREHMEPRLAGLLLAALFLNIAAELSFIFYDDPCGPANFIGHLVKLIAVVLVYHALVEGTLRTPYGTLFRELTALNRNLDAELQQRMDREARLRATNREFATLYRSAQLLHSTLRLDALTHLILSMAASAAGGDFQRAMLFMVNARAGILQGMLGIDRDGAALVLPQDKEEVWGAPQLDPAICAAQRETAVSRAVVKQRLDLAADDNALAQSCLERRLILVDNPAAEPAGGRRFAGELGLQVYACAPLLDHEEPFAVLVVDLATVEGDSIQERLRFLELFSRQAAAALENARLLHRLERAHRELREVQEQLIQGEKLAVLGEMAAQVAHELRNPLVSVGGFAQRLVKLDLGNERASEYAAIIAREVRRLEEMLGNILAFSKKQLVCFEACDMNALVAEALELEAELRRSAGIALLLDVVAPLPEIVGDCRQLRQVLLNLLSNARQAMTRGGTLTLRAGCCTLRGEEALAIEVEDTGGGISPEIMRNIFNPFFSTHPKGTGLGLSISHRIVEQHHGEIEVINGIQGACFIVRLPLRPPKSVMR